MAAGASGGTASVEADSNNDETFNEFIKEVREQCSELLACNAQIMFDRLCVCDMIKGYRVVSIPYRLYKRLRLGQDS